MDFYKRTALAGPNHDPGNVRFGFWGGKEDLTATMMYREMGMTYWLEQAEAAMKESNA